MVAGVAQTDPRQVARGPAEWRSGQLQQMLELASLGAAVLQSRARGRSARN